MARLNEPPVSLETIDALKRRFIRQNRDIARVNSTQSLRIRNLESEVSRLLSENLSLRERVVRLQHEVDKAVDHSVLDDMGAIKSKIETKLAELGGFVEELSKMQKNAENRRIPKRRSSVKKSPTKSPDQKNWKNVLTLSEVTCGGDHRLPPIVEGKCFPRKTLDIKELDKISPDITNMNDSPEIGPPPIAHFEEGDPVNFYPERRYIASKVSPKLEDKNRPDTFTNLGARKKRRETSNLEQALLDEPLETDSVQSNNPSITSFTHTQPFKSGAKRKLDTREGDDKDGPTKTLEADDLFDRRPLNSAKVSPAKQSTVKLGSSASHTIPQDINKGVSSARAKETNNSTTSTNRKVLGPKNVNTDPTSPTKASRLTTNGKNADFKDRAAKKTVDRALSKEKPPKSHDTNPRISDPSHATTLNVDLVKAGPETPVPATVDNVSPVSSEPSTTRQDSRDTPPPADLNPDAAHAAGLSAASRATRRPRGSVSYAEPNLRAKMRRPTKDLVDAVSTSQRLHNVITIKDEDNAEPESAPEKNGLRTIVIKKEDMSNSINPWKIACSTENNTHQPRFNDEERSPLINKTAASSAQLPASIIADRRRRTVGTQRGEDESDKRNNQSSNTGSTITSLIKGNQISKNHNENRPAHNDANAEAVPTKESLPPEDSTKSEGKPEHATTKPTRPQPNMPPEETKVDGRQAAMAKARERKRELRLSAMVDDRIGEELSSARSMARLRGEGPGAAQDGATGRMERAATRRRSMML